MCVRVCEHVCVFVYVCIALVMLYLEFKLAISPLVDLTMMFY